ncbi:GH25 family lysozyme [Enterococcus malodoratus]|uniref:DUF5648 domain-containing protein n=1 Tax=Enterococcus malodoratus ATCC 43197 TaxID=1158601 RepID=R2QYI8_9ENTE|nr:GH25 family lysozyme [Enterococcus malodoratus]EOH73486.1 hypothetical protein UAI_03583 [Enterococcus malodoratus ATCC 43197]EOT67244.1 hypothetical protein I585_02765 [Enterococcus malodoratus ATCC 43197]SPW90878.1 glycosyl hydrolase family 25 [Enterococcus malodoratus]STD69504.1 glycosyl hydrolase family 25 [Enterococcus malodoratus]
MKKKLLGITLLTIISLNITSVNASESQENTSETAVSVTDSSETAPSSEEANQTAEEVIEEEGNDVADLSQLDTTDGTVSMPRGRSDIYQSIQPYASLPSVSATNNNTPSKSFIDISSHNGNLTVANFQKMKEYGLTGVVVKLTEATSYTNPYAQSQINNAQAAGMKVSAYHYSWFTTDAQAAAEADYFAATAKRFGLSTSTVMVNDIEEPNIAGKSDHTTNSRAFENRLKALGYGNVRHYIGLHWLNSGLINGNTIGNKNIWVAAYPYTLSTTNLYTQYGAWQWSSQFSFPGISGNFDINADYTSIFSNPTTTPPADSVQMYRLYNPNSGEHFYTQNVAEKNNLISKGWRDEGIGWNAPTSGNPVYRLYNPNAGDHHYTLHASEKDHLVKVGWRYEGVGWSSGGANMLHRLYNPNAKAGAHHYTLNSYEKDNLVKHGWRYEGLAWYAK